MSLFKPTPFWCRRINTIRIATTYGSAKPKALPFRAFLESTFYAYARLPLRICGTASRFLVEIRYARIRDKLLSFRLLGTRFETCNKIGSKMLESIATPIMPFKFCKLCFNNKALLFLPSRLT